MGAESPIPAKPDPKPDPPPDLKAEKKTPVRSRSAAPFVIVLLCAASLLAWYFFSYTPKQLRYFLSLRFRTMAVIGGQVQSRIDSLQAAIRYARESVKDGKDGNPARYLEKLTPLKENQGGNLAGQELGHGQLKMIIPWRDIIKESAALSSVEFDDLLLADKDGLVVWQREADTPRLGKLTEFFKQPKAESSWLPFSISSLPQPMAESPKEPVAVPASTFFLRVNLTGTPSFLVVHPVSVAADKGSKIEFYVAGLLSEERLRSQAMHLPPFVVLLAGLPFVVLLLLIPYVKIHTLTPAERFSMADSFSVVTSATLLVSIVAVIPFSARFSSGADQSLERFATRINDHLKVEVNQVLDFLWAVSVNHRELRNHLQGCDVKVENLESKLQCRFWEAAQAIEKKAVAPADLAIGTLDLDVIVWLNQQGLQIDKWTTKQQVTVPIETGAVLESFREMRAGHDWAILDEKGQIDPIRLHNEFLLEPVRSPTTSDLAFLFTTRVHNDKNAPAGAAYLQANVRPQSLARPLLPPGYGFAIIDRDGRVLFHSRMELSLAENLFAEAPKAEALRRVVIDGTPAHLDADYHGRPHRFFVTPVFGLHKCPWIIVTFHDQDEDLEFSMAQQTGGALLFAANLAVFSFVAFAFACYLGWRSHNVRDGYLICFARPSRFAFWAQIGLLAIAVAALAVTFRDNYQWLAPAYWCFLFLPPVSLFCSLFPRRHPAPNALKDFPPQYHYAGKRPTFEILLVVCLVGALPAAGLSRISYRIAEMDLTVNQLRQAQEQWHSRVEILQRDVANSPLYSIETSKILTTQGFASTREPEAVPNIFAPDGLDPRDCLNRAEPAFSYLPSVAGICVQDEVSGIASDNGKIFSERVLDWIWSRISDVVPDIPGHIAKHGSLGGDRLDSIGFLNREGKNNRLALQELGHTFLTLYRASRDLPPKGILAAYALIAIASLIGLALILAAFHWAVRQLTGPVKRNAAPALESNPLGKREDLLRFDGTLVIGAPRVKKDLVVKALATASDTYMRIRLPEAQSTPEWVEQQVALANKLPPSTTADGLAWIHLSNLEAQLATRASRDTMLDLLEKLLNTAPGAGPRHIVITSSIDPILHMAEVFQEERGEIYQSSQPELVLKRWTLLLSRLGRAFLSIQRLDPWDAWLAYEPEKWKEVLLKEAGRIWPLQRITEDLIAHWSSHEAVDRLTLRIAFCERAEAYYQLLWVSCTRSEKLVLIQLAQEGLINPKTRSVLYELTLKGLVIPGPPRIFNLSFKEFLMRTERDSVVEEWEGEQGIGIWRAAQQSVVGVAFLGLLFFAYSQGLSTEGLIAILTASGVLGTPFAKGLLAGFSGKKE